MIGKWMSSEIKLQGCSLPDLAMRASRIDFAVVQPDILGVCLATRRSEERPNLHANMCYVSSANFFVVVEESELAKTVLNVNRASPVRSDWRKSARL